MVLERITGRECHKFLLMGSFASETNTHAGPEYMIALYGQTFAVPPGQFTQLVNQLDIKGIVVTDLWSYFTSSSAGNVFYLLFGDCCLDGTQTLH